MTLSDFRNITDELLSAYIDDEVTEQERSLVEQAIAADEVIAWRVDSLRQTVNMLQDLPELTMPRSFTFTFEQLNATQSATQSDGQLAGVAAEQSPVERRQGAVPLARSGASVGSSPDFWDQLQQGWREFWQAGNPLLRNAAAVSFALMIMLTSGGPVLMRAMMQPVGQSGEMSASAPAAAPAADIVALVPAVPGEPQAAIQESPNESAQSQGTDAAGKQGADADARTMSADAESDEAESSESAGITQDAPTEEGVAEVVEESVEETAPEEDAAAEKVIAEADSVTGTEVTGERLGPQSSAATAMMAPPGMGGGSGGEGRGGDEMGTMGGGMEVSPGFGGPDTLVPSGAYSYDEAPVLQQTPIPAEEAVGASVAAVPEDERVPVATEVANETTSRMAAPESSVTQPNQSETVTSEASVPEQPAAEPTIEPTIDPTVEPTVEPTVDPTAAAVALLAPEEITSSDVVQNASLDSTVIVTGGAQNLPILWVAQGGTLVLTVVLSSLWWHSRRPRRLDRDK